MSNRNRFKVGDLVEWTVGKTNESVQGIVISYKEMPSHLHYPGKKGVTSGIMLEVLFESTPTWVSENQCRVISEKP